MHSDGGGCCGLRASGPSNATTAARHAAPYRRSVHPQESGCTQCSEVRHTCDDFVAVA
jgi:hypothetical protein